MASGREKTRQGWCSGRGVFAWVVINVLGLCLSGCVIGPIIGQFTGRRSETVKVEAKYELPSGNMLILVDSPAGVARSSGVRSALSRELEREMGFHSLAPSVIPVSELPNLMLGRDDFEELSISQIGRELSAQYVLYVQVTQFQLGTMVDKPAGQGLIRARVTVFDVAQKQRVWPEMEPRGYEVIVQTPFREAVGNDYQHDFTQDLCQRMAVKIIKLFREHKELRVPEVTK